MLEVTESEVEVVIDIETPEDIVGCGQCGTRAEAQDGMPVEIRDLACFGAVGSAGVAHPGAPSTMSRP